MKALFILLLCIFASISTSAQRDFSNSDITKVILLGTGNPNPAPNQSGCSVLILVNDTPYIVDFGPGLIRRAAALTPKYGGKLENFKIAKLKHAFLTHLHSDHTTGYPDLILTPWVMGRNAPLQVYGPEGTDKLTSNILKAYEDDIRYRVYGTEMANDLGWRVNSHEFMKEGIIYQDDNVKVEAFPVTHGTWPNAWGFRFTTPDKVIVISGDTTPNEKVIEYAKGADILIHEVYSKAAFDKRKKSSQEYHKKQHTSTYELGKIGNKTNPGIIVLYHILFWGYTEQDLLDEISTVYKGKVISGRDLDIF